MRDGRDRCIGRRLQVLARFGERLHPSPGSESMACNKSGSVNVGDPNTSAKEAVLTDKPKQRGR